MITYKKAGVDIKKAEIFVKKIRGRDESQPFLGFASVFDTKVFKNYKNPFLVSSCDGVGTKLKIAQQLDIHYSVGIDLVAMNVNDIVCLGAEPLFFLDYIACGKLKINILTSIIKGIKRGLKEAGCVLIGGETAEMPGMYRNNEYDLAGFCVGVVEKNRLIDGRRIKKGDVVLGLASSGIHSNGYSLIRKILTPKDIIKYSSQLLKPTRIYVKSVLSLLKATGYNFQIIKGIAHITGGAFYNKAVKILPPSLGMIINKRSWPVPKIFRVIREKGKISDNQMYSVFNMGIGMIIVVDRIWAERIQKILASYRVASYIIGKIVVSRSKVRIL